MPTLANRMTAEEFAVVHDSDRYELVAGEPVEKPMSNWTVLIGLKISYALMRHLDANPVGIVLGDNTTYRCFPDDPEQVRKPDCSAFLASRWSPRLLDSTHIEAAPDLIVEVVSPNELTYGREEKVERFLAAGTREAWVVHPNTRRLERRFPNGTSRWYKESETLDATPLFPGFTLVLEDVFARGK
jgi:Uma2 family endonuclease